MATMTSNPLHILGKRTDSYDFEDQQNPGKRISGENDVLAVYDETAKSAFDLKVHKTARGLFATVPEGSVLVLALDVQARGNRLDQRALAIVSEA